MVTGVMDVVQIPLLMGFLVGLMSLDKDDQVGIGAVRVLSGKIKLILVTMTFG